MADDDGGGGRPVQRAARNAPSPPVPRESTRAGVGRGTGGRVDAHLAVRPGRSGREHAGRVGRLRVDRVAIRRASRQPTGCRSRDGDQDVRSPALALLVPPAPIVPRSPGGRRVGRSRPHVRPVRGNAGGARPRSTTPGGRTSPARRSASPPATSRACSGGTATLSPPTPISRRAPTRRWTRRWGNRGISPWEAAWRYRVSDESPGKGVGQLPGEPREPEDSCHWP